MTFDPSNNSRDKAEAIGRIVTVLPRFDLESLISFAERLEARLQEHDGPTLRLAFPHAAKRTRAKA